MMPNICKPTGKMVCIEEEIVVHCWRYKVLLRRSAATLPHCNRISIPHPKPTKHPRFPSDQTPSPVHQMPAAQVLTSNFSLVASKSQSKEKINNDFCLQKPLNRRRKAAGMQHFHLTAEYLSDQPKGCFDNVQCCNKKRHVCYPYIVAICV